MKKTTSVILVICFLALALTGCEAESTNTDTVGEEKSTTSAFPAEYDNCTLNVTGAHTDGKYLTVEATYTNNNDEPLYAWCSFVLEALQGGVSLEEVSDINGAEASLIKEVKDGASVDVSYKFEMENEDEEIEIIVATPTADADVLAEKFFDDIDLSE